MALELPDWLTDAFNLIGLPWPGVDEDQLHAWATSVRNFATDITDNSSQTNQAMRELAGSSQSSVITVVADQYESHHRLLTELHGPMDDFAQALDYAADAVVAQKWVVIGAATALAAEFTATQIGAVFTLGADEAALPEEIISTQQIVKFALKDLEAVVIGRLINWGAQVLSDHVNRSIVTLANDAWSVKMEADGLKIAYENIRRTASQIRGHADEAENIGSSAEAENTSRDLEDNSGGSGWSEVINALKQGLHDIASDLFKSLPGTIARILRDIAGTLENFASKLKAADDSSTIAPSTDAAGATPVAGPTPGSEPIPGPEPTSSSTAEQQQVVDAHVDGADGTTDDPIDLVTGEMFLPQEDLVLPGVLPLVLERRHRSAYRYGRHFGTTWASTLDQRIEINDEEIRLILEDGRILHYPVPAVDEEQVMPSHGPRWPLAWDREDDLITIVQGDWGRTLHFPPGSLSETTRPLAAITDRAGNRITFAYDEEGISTDVHHSGGYHIIVDTISTFGGVRVSSLKLTDPGGAPNIPVREFRYDMAGRLTGVINGSGIPLAFEYDSQQRITRWVDRNGFDYRYIYRADGRVVRGEGTGGFLDITLDYNLTEHTTTVTDALGRSTVYHWNERFQTVKVTDALGNETRTAKDRYGNIITSIDELGRTTRIERDGYGDPTLITRPDGSTASISYDDERLPISATGPDGRTWTYEYGHHGQLVLAAGPAEAVTRYERDGRGRLTAVTDALGGTTLVHCDDAGLPVEVHDPLGARTMYRRDAFGRIIEVTDPLGAVTRFTWNGEGKPLTRVQPDGATESWEYDPEGILLAYTDPAGQVTRFEYGPFDLPAQRTDPDGASYRFAYTPRLHLESVTNGGDQVWRYEYDPTGNLIAETDFNGARQTYTLDAAGHLIARANQAGQQTVYTHDVLGRLTKRMSGHDLYRYSYDPAGHLVHAEGPDTILDYVRDLAGRITSETVNGRTQEIRFDAAGRRISRTTPTGVTSEWSHDAAGRTTGFRTGDDTLEFSYDASGNEIGRRLGPAAALTQSFDAAGRLLVQGIWALDQSGSSPGPSTDTTNSWQAVQQRTYAYGSHGLPVEIDDRLRGVRRFSLDSSGRIVRVQAATWREEYAYDSLGNVTTAQVSALEPAQDTSGQRALDGTLLRRAGRTRYEYDLAGRLIRQTRRTLSGKTRTWTYTWNADDQLTTVTTPSNGTWRYTYDPLGRRLAKRRIPHDDTTASAQVTEEVWFTWDGPRVTEQTQVRIDGRVSVLTWDYQPGDFTPVAQIHRATTGLADPEEIDRQFFAIVADLVGTPQELVTPYGEVAWHATTSIWGRTITAPDSQTDCPLRFPGQYYDEETGLSYNLNRYYDSATGRYLTSDPFGLDPSPNPTTYVGNPFIEIDPLGLAIYTDPGAKADYFADNPLQNASRQARLNDNNKDNLYGAFSAGGRIFPVHSDSEGHIEENMLQEVRRAGMKPEDIDAVYTEYGMCPRCQGLSRQKSRAVLPHLRQDVELTYSFPFADPASRPQARIDLKNAVDKLFAGK